MLTCICYRMSSNVHWLLYYKYPPVYTDLYATECPQVYTDLYTTEYPPVYTDLLAYYNMSSNVHWLVCYRMSSYSDLYTTGYPPVYTGLLAYYKMSSSLHELVCYRMSSSVHWLVYYKIPSSEQGRIQGGRRTRYPPLKLDKNMIFHTKYPKNNFRASLRYARLF